MGISIGKLTRRVL